MNPIVVINFKTYEGGSGENALDLARACDEISNEKGIDVIVAPQAPDIFRIASQVGIPVIAQTVDAIKAGRNTGRISPMTLKLAGASGVMINHSECRKSIEEIEKVIALCKEAELFTICCADTPEHAAEVAKLGPDFIAIEPPELIATGVSVSTAKPEVVTKGAEMVSDVNPNIIVLCGAGVTNNDDFRKALELGTAGVLVSSAVVNAKDQRLALLELLSSV